MLNYRFDWPPSVNNYWGHKGTMRFVKKRARDFRKSVCEVVEEGGAPSLGDRLAIHVELRPPNKRKFDIDNYVKPLLDAMEIANVYKNDGQIDRLMVERLPIDPTGTGCVDVTVILNPNKVVNTYDDQLEKSDIDRRARLIEFHLQNRDVDNARAVAMDMKGCMEIELKALPKYVSPSTRWVSEVYARRLVVAQEAGCRKDQIDRIIAESIEATTPSMEGVGSIALGDLADYDAETEELFASVNGRDWRIADLAVLDSEMARILQAKSGKLWRIFQIALSAVPMDLPKGNPIRGAVNNAVGGDPLPYLDIQKLEEEAFRQAMEVCGRVGNQVQRVLGVPEQRIRAITRRAARSATKNHPHLLK